MVCKNCGCKIPDGVAACRVCGWSETPAAPVTPPPFNTAGPEEKPSAPKNTCPHCGRPVEENADFCGRCQKRLRPIVVPAPMEERVPRKDLPPTEPARVDPVAVPVDQEPVRVQPVVPVPVIEIPAPMKNCPHCGQSLPVEAKFCNSCGSKIEAAPAAPVSVSSRLCPKCGQELAMDAKFCYICGCDLTASAISNAGAVKVTDPVVTTAEKKARAQQSRSGKSGKWIIISVVAVALAIVVGLGVWIGVEDPFDWFSGSSSSSDRDDDDDDKKDDKSDESGDEEGDKKARTPETVAVNVIKALEACDAKKYVSYYHETFFNTQLDRYEYESKEEYIESLQYDMDERRRDIEGELGEGYTYTVEAVETETVSEKRLEEIKAEFSEDFGLEIEDYQYVHVRTTFTGEEGEETSDYYCDTIKVDGKWYSVY